MSIFSRSVSDDEWTNRVHNSNLLPMLITLTERYDKGHEIGSDGDVFEKHTAMRLLLHSCPSILRDLNSIPAPSSKEAKDARKALLTAIEYYIRSANDGIKWMDGLMGDIGERMQYDDWMGRMAERRLEGYHKTYTQLGEAGYITLREAVAYLSNVP